jgi:hypothetical protein
LVSGEFDHVLLMGPLYHLPDEADMVVAVNTAMRLLKTDGLLYSAFISSYAAAWGYLARFPDDILDDTKDFYFQCVREQKDFSGIAFTQNHFILPSNVDVFMRMFSLEKLHIIGCESVLALRERELMQESEDILQKWIDFAIALCEREEFISMSHHILHIGRKR